MPANSNERRPISACRRSGWSRLARYDLIGDLSDTDVATLTRRLLANDTIEISTEGELPASSPGRHPPMCGSTTCRSPS